MELYLMRHGDAERGVAGQPDASRALTAEGRSEVERAVRRATKGGMRPSVIVSSPYRRALETARIAAEVSGFNGEILTAEELVPHGAPEAVWAELRVLGRGGSVVVTSHEPLVSGCVAFLLGCPSLSLQVRTGTIIRIDVGEGRSPGGNLRWMITPKIS